MEKTLKLIVDKLESIDSRLSNLETGQKKIEKILHRIEVSKQVDIKGMLTLISNKLDNVATKDDNNYLLHALYLHL